PLPGACGAAVAISSLSNGIGWSSGGVDAGTFPFITGLIILSGSIFNLLRGELADYERMLDWSELKRLGALFIPAAIYVGAIPLLGMYAASAAYVFGTFAFQSPRIGHPFVARRRYHCGCALSRVRAHVRSLASARPSRRGGRFLSMENLEALLHGFAI